MAIIQSTVKKNYFMEYFTCEKHEDTVGFGAIIEP